MKQFRCIKLIFILCICIFCMTCCSNEYDSSKVDASQGIYHIYYKNADSSKLVWSEYNTNTPFSDKEALVSELIKQLKTQKKDDPSIVPAVSSNIKVIDSTIKKPFLTLDFSSEYSKQGTTDEILCRAAIVLTLVQIQDIDCVEIKVDGQPLLDASNIVVGKMSAEKFLSNTNSNLSSSQKSTFILYFADKNKKDLKEVERTVLNDSSITPEKLVLKLLADGPLNDAALPVLSDSVSVLDLSVKSGVCYINFNSAFVDDPVDLPADLIIYSIVNSVTEIVDIQQVQFSVDGKTDIMFMDKISLKDPFSKNMAYVKNDSK